MTPDIDRLTNCAAWRDTIIQRHQLDIAALQEGRAHQMVDKDAHPTKNAIGPTHVMTPWSRDWVRERVMDAIAHHNREHVKAMRLLKTPHDEHEMTTLQETAVDLFGASHDETCGKLVELLPSIKNEKMRANLESHINYVRRHEQTIKHQVKAARDLAKEQVENGLTITSVPAEELVEHYLALTQDLLREVGSDKVEA